LNKNLALILNVIGKNEPNNGGIRHNNRKSLKIVSDANDNRGILMAIKIIIGSKGKSKTVELTDVKSLMGKKIGDVFKGEIIDMTGYEFQITGASDNAGFPLRKDVDGPLRKKILAVQGIGLKKKAKGIKQRKTVTGNTISQSTAAVNVKVAKEGKQPLFDAKVEEPAEEA
jgi:small subunit ribosomal protein S6e